MSICFHVASVKLSIVRLVLHVAIVAGLSCVIAQAQTSGANASITGLVRTAAGQSVSRAKVKVHSEASSTDVETTTGSDGSFAVNSLQAGSYLLTIKAAESQTIEQEVKVSAGERRQLTFTLKSTEARSDRRTVAAGDIQLQDQPNFAIAGISDWTAAGGHGSDANLRTSENLAKETAGLKQSAEPASRTLDQLRQAREQAEKSIATNNSADGYRQLGDIDEELGDSLSAVREYEKAAQIEPSEQNYFSWGAELLLHRAVQPAANVFARGARAHPGSARMLSGWGAALYASGQYQQAAQRLCEASDLQPGEAAPYLFLGKMQKTAPEPLPCAEEKLSRFAANQPNNALAHYYYAVSMLKRLESSKTNSDDLLRAQELLNRALGVNPKLVEALVELGFLRFSSGDFPAAIGYYRTAIEGNPSFAEAHFRLAMAYRKTGERERARREFQLYEQINKNESEQIERQRRELKQFVVTLKEQAVSH